MVKNERYLMMNGYRWGVVVKRGKRTIQKKVEEKGGAEGLV